MKDFNLKGYLLNKTLMYESLESDKFGQTQESNQYTGNDPYDKEYELPGIDDKPGYDVFGGYQGPRIKNAVVSLVRGGYSEGDILHYVRAVIKAAKNMK